MDRQDHSGLYIVRMSRDHHMALYKTTENEEAHFVAARSGLEGQFFAALCSF